MFSLTFLLVYVCMFEQLGFVQSGSKLLKTWKRIYLLSWLGIGTRTTKYIMYVSLCSSVLVVPGIARVASCPRLCSPPVFPACLRSSKAVSSSTLQQQQQQQPPQTSTRIAARRSDLGKPVVAIKQTDGRTSVTTLFSHTSTYIIHAQGDRTGTYRVCVDSVSKRSSSYLSELRLFELQERGGGMRSLVTFSRDHIVRLSVLVKLLDFAHRV